MSLLRPTYSFPTLTPEPSQHWSQNSGTGDSLRRVTIKQLLTATEIDQHNFCVGQQPLKKFLLVANVYRNQILLSGSRITYGFDDGSGKISGFKTDTGTSDQTFDPFTYATILGQLSKVSNGSLVVKVSHILPVNDPHEIYFHILHVIFDEVQSIKGSPRREDWLDSQSLDHEIVSSFQAFDLSSRLSDLEESIITDIENIKEAHDDGESLWRGVQIIDLVGDLLPAHQDKNANDFSDAIERLINMRVLRPTIDDNHLDLVGNI